MKDNLRIHYDKEADFLEITAGKRKKGHFEDIEPGITKKIDEKTLSRWRATFTGKPVEMGGSLAKQGRHKEYQVKVNLRTTTTTSPAVLSVVAGEDTLEGEEYL